MRASSCLDTRARATTTTTTSVQFNLFALNEREYKSHTLFAGWQAGWLAGCHGHTPDEFAFARMHFAAAKLERDAVRARRRRIVTPPRRWPPASRERTCTRATRARPWRAGIRRPAKRRSSAACVSARARASRANSVSCSGSNKRIVLVRAIRVARIMLICSHCKHSAVCLCSSELVAHAETSNK